MSSIVRPKDRMVTESRGTTTPQQVREELIPASLKQQKGPLDEYVHQFARKTMKVSGLTSVCCTSV